MDISGLEDEFRLSGSMPRLLYVKTPAPEREPRLTAMIDEIEAQGDRLVPHVLAPRASSARLVRDDLAVLLSERFAAGRGRAGGPAIGHPGRPAATLASGDLDVPDRARAATSPRS